MGCGCGGSQWTPPPPAGAKPAPTPTGPQAPGYYHQPGASEAVLVNDQGASMRVPVRKYPPRG